MSAPAAFLATPVTLGDETKTVAEWCAERGLLPQTVYIRRRRNSWADSLKTGVKSGDALRRRIDTDLSKRREG